MPMTLSSSPLFVQVPLTRKAQAGEDYSFSPHLRHIPVHTCFTSTGERLFLAYAASCSSKVAIFL